MSSESTRWTVTVADVLRVEDQSGTLICTLRGKTASLFLTLARAKPKRLLRDRLARDLWPNASLDDCRASLRQALRKLRGSLGNEAVLADRSFCSIRPEIRIEFKHSEHGTRCERPEGPARATPLDGLLGFSEWLARNDPAHLFESLRSNLEYAIHLPPQQLTALLNEAEPGITADRSNQNWCLFWRGAANIQRGVRHAMPLLREASHRAFAADDRLLIREATYLWAICEILTGDAEKALALSDRAIAAIRDRDLLHCGRLLDLRSSALIHLGFNADGLKLLECRPSGSGSQLEAAKNEALRALYTATSGNLKSAHSLNQAPQKLALESGAKGVDLICGLTAGCIEAIDQPEKAITRLGEMVGFCKDNGFGHIALYAQETLALAYRNRTLLDEARRAMNTSIKMRKGLGFCYTRWDQTRLRSLIPLMSSTA